MPHFIKTILPTQGFYCTARLTSNGGFKHQFFEDVDSTIAHLEEQDRAGCTMYLAQASYKTFDNRKTENALYVRNFWFDIDCGQLKFTQTPDKAYLTQRDGVDAVKAFTKVLDLPLPSIVVSGYGLYAHYLIDENIPAEKWKVLATILKRVATAAGFKQDPSRTSDTSSVLRPVGTTNRKRGEEKPVKLVHLSQSMPLTVFVTALEAAAKRLQINSETQQLPTQFKKLNDEFMSGVDGPPSSLLIVSEKCAQIRRVKDTRGNVEEPTWYNFLGMARYTTEGKEIVILHEWSKGHPDYTPEATTKKIQQHEHGGYGPTTCEKFGSDNPSGCVECPHANSVKSPITLGRMIASTVDQDGAKPKTNIKTMENLLSMVFQEIRWAVPGLLPEGLAIISGPPKIGKSWVVLDVCLASSTGGTALGHYETVKGSVLLLALEDNDRRLQSRLKMRLKDIPRRNLEGFHYETAWPRIDEGGLQQLREWLELHSDCKLIVIDTLQKVKPLGRKNQGNAYESDYQALGPLQELALSKNVCILVVHHNRKSGDNDALMTISGSVGITGVCDTILLLTRPRGATDAILTVTGRDINEHTVRMIFDGTTGAWLASGASPLEVSMGDTSTLIMKFMRSHSEQVFNCKDLFGAMGLTIELESFRKALNRLCDKALLEKIGANYGLPKEIAG